MKALPDEIIIYSIPYKVIYHDSLSELDKMGKEKLFGKIVPYSNEIHIYKGSRSVEAIWQTIWHEVFHNILDSNRIDLCDESNDEEKIISMLAIGLNDVLFKNKLEFNKKLGD